MLFVRVEIAVHILNRLLVVFIWVRGCKSTDKGLIALLTALALLLKQFCHCFFQFFEPFFHFGQVSGMCLYSQ